MLFISQTLFGSFFQYLRHISIRHKAYHYYNTICYGISF